MGSFRQKRKMPESELKKIPADLYFELVRQAVLNDGRAAVTVTGGSMKPFLHPVRDSVELVPLKNGLRRGDIVLYETTKGRYILHRVTRVGMADFDMRGDHTAGGEKQLHTERIIGVADSVRRNGRCITRRSFRFRFYAFSAPFHYLPVTLREGKLRRLLSKLYHALKGGKKTNAEN